ncbi:TPA: hypothetical protein ACH3X2_007280 [Trebouxia sp. C0005]
MSPQSWHGLSHKNAWSDVGDSYSKLAQRSEKIDESNASPAYGSLSCLPAGVVSRTKPKGAGSFQLQSDWSLSTDASGLRSYGTEATEKFRSPPSGARPAAAQNQQELHVLQIQALFWGHLPLAAQLHRLMQLQLATLRSPLTDGTMRDSAGITLPVYNIITGEAPKHNDKSKYWSGQNMDYRRRR